ncbi:7077_t:CDS:2, partial [Paraglomus brasilianum]
MDPCDYGPLVPLSPVIHRRRRKLKKEAKERHDLESSKRVKKAKFEGEANLTTSLFASPAAAEMRKKIRKPPMTAIKTNNKWAAEDDEILLSLITS